MGRRPRRPLIFRALGLRRGCRTTACEAFRGQLASSINMHEQLGLLVATKYAKYETGNREGLNCNEITPHLIILGRPVTADGPVGAKAY